MLSAYLRWTATASNYWSSYGTTNPGNGDGKYYITIGEALYVGREEDPGDFWSLEEAMADVLPDKRIVNNRQTFDTFVDKMEVQAPESVYTGNCAAQNCVLADPMVSVLINASSAQVFYFSIFASMSSLLGPCLCKSCCGSLDSTVLQGRAWSCMCRQLPLHAHRVHLRGR